MCTVLPGESFTRVRHLARGTGQGEGLSSVFRHDKVSVWQPDMKKLNEEPDMWGLEARKRQEGPRARTQLSMVECACNLSYSGG